MMLPVGNRRKLTNFAHREKSNLESLEMPREQVREVAK